MSDKLCIRRSDGTVWEPSHPDGYTEGDAIADVLLGRSRWFFRQVEWRPSPWWRFWSRGRWVRSGDVWEPVGGREFEITRRAAP